MKTDRISSRGIAALEYTSLRAGKSDGNGMERSRNSGFVAGGATRQAVYSANGMDLWWNDFGSASPWSRIAVNRERCKCITQRRGMCKRFVEFAEN